MVGKLDCQPVSVWPADWWLKGGAEDKRAKSAAGDYLAITLQQRGHTQCKQCRLSQHAQKCVCALDYEST